MSWNRHTVLIALALTLAAGIGACAEFDTVQAEATRSRLHTVTYTVQIFVADTGTVPSDLRELLEPVGKHRPYLKKNQLVDAWGRPIEYSVENDTFRLVSAGVDGEMNTLDDIITRASLFAAVDDEQEETAKPWKWLQNPEDWSLMGM